MRPCAGPRLCPAAMALRPHPVRAAQGFVLVSALSGVLMVVLILVAVWSQLAASHVEAQQDARRARLVGQAQAALLVWLRTHLAALDSIQPPPGGLPDPADAVRGLIDSDRLQIALSLPLTQGAVQCRMVAVWWPGLQGDTRFDPVRGQFSQLATDTRYALIDGCSEERRAVAQAQASLRLLAATLERWFQARVQDDPLHRLDRDHFNTPAGDCQPVLADLPCLTGFTPLGSITLLQQVPGMTAGTALSPWGADVPIEVSSPPSSLQSPPFQWFLRVRTPWGSQLTAVAVQPGA